MYVTDTKLKTQNQPTALKGDKLMYQQIDH